MPNFLHYAALLIVVIKAVGLVRPVKQWPDQLWAAQFYFFAKFALKSAQIIEKWLVSILF